MALSLDESVLFRALVADLESTKSADDLNDAYYEGSQRLTHIGLAVPPELRHFETVVNWSRTAVDSIVQRLAPKAIRMPGSMTADPVLQEGFAANNLESELPLLWTDTLVYGRGFTCVGANAEDPDHPLITVESPREMAVKIDPRTKRVAAALRLYGGTTEKPEPVLATLYMPDRTVWLEKQSGGWVDVDADQHNLGRVPVVPFWNRRRTGRWTGVTEMADIKPLVDAAARALTNLQIAAETHSVPQKWVLGMSKGDFVDKDGNPIPAWQSYYTAIWANQNQEAKVGQFEASSLKNFHDTVNHYAQLAAGITGLPMRYFGQNAANPPSAEGIRADDSRVILRSELQQKSSGDGLGDTFALYTRIRDGEWVDGNRVSVDWFDAGTPTYASQVDAIQKLTGKPLLSREGGWDELGWDEERKAREREYMDREASDPALERIARDLVGRGAATSDG